MDEGTRASDAEPAREGLPKSYRMRAEPHYVDELTGRASGKERRSARRAEAPLGDTLPFAQRALAELGAGLATIGATAAQLSVDASPLARRVQVDLIRAEAWRAAWLLRVHQLTSGADATRIRPVALGAVLDHVRAGLGPEARLLGASLEWRASDWHAAVAADEQALVAGLTGALFATLGLTGAAATVVRIRVDARAGELRAVDVGQQDVDPAATVAERFFDATFTDRPGGWIAAIGAHAARVTARLHRGDAQLVPADRGTLLRLTFAAD